jgi:predicted phosphodiesterase
MRLGALFIVLPCLVLVGCAANTAGPAVDGVAAIGPNIPSRLLAQAASSAAPSSQQVGLKLPLEPKSVRFAVIGDSGTGDSPQFEVAREMEAYRQAADFTFVLMLGDNIYGGDSPSDYARKFEEPYKSLLDAGVKFYASLGNHDNPDERKYKPFNMGGERYYSFKKNDVTFFALDSTYMSPEQLNWLEEQLRSTSSGWKICYFHHPLYSDGKFHGPDLDLRGRLAPLLEKYGVNVVFSGHDHVYERLKPENGIYYFVLGNSGQLRYRNLKKSQEEKTGFDTDRDFMLVEITGDKLYFQTISRTGATVDFDILQRQPRLANLDEVRRPQN